MDYTLRDVTRAVGATVKTVAEVAVDKARDLAAEYEQNRGLSTGSYRGRDEGRQQGPPKIESGAYSTGRMVGFGSDSMPRGGSDSYGARGGGGYGGGGHHGGGGGGGGGHHGGGGYNGGGGGGGGGGMMSKFAEEERQLRERRLASRGGHGNRDAYDRDDEGRFDGYGRSGSDGGGRDELSARAMGSGGYAVPGAPTSAPQRQEHSRQTPSWQQQQQHVPRVESGQYSTGRMEGFGSDDVRARGGGGGGYGGDYGAGGGLMGGDREAGSDDWTHGRRGGGGAADRVESGYYTRESHSGYYVRSKASKDEDDEGHGADAWTSSIEFEADGSQRVVKLGEEPDGSRPQGRPPSVPRPTLPRPSVGSAQHAIGSAQARLGAVSGE